MPTWFCNECGSMAYWETQEQRPVECDWCVLQARNARVEAAAKQRRHGAACPVAAGERLESFDACAGCSS